MTSPAVDLRLASPIRKERVSCPPQVTNGAIPFTIENLSQLPFSDSVSDHRRSEDVRIGDVTWCVLIGKVKHDPEVTTLSFWVGCQMRGCYRWVCDADLEFRLVSQRSPQRTDEQSSISWRSRRLFATITAADAAAAAGLFQISGFDDFDDFDQVCNPVNGFIADDCIYVEVVVRDMRSFTLTDSICLPPKSGPVPVADHAEVISQLLNNQYMSDVVFCIRNTTFYAHKLVLCARCPALYDLLKVRLPLQTHHRTDRLDPDAFLSLLSLIYRKQLVLNECNLLSVYHCATYFGLPEVRRAALLLITPDNVFYYSRMALDHDNDDLYDACIKIIAKNMGSVVGTKGWLSAHKRVVKTITLQDELNISERGLFDAVLIWCKEQSLRTGESLRETANDLVSNIRFTTMTLNEFSKGPAHSDVLDNDKKLHIILYLADDSGNAQIPDNLVCRKRRPVPD